LHETIPPVAFFPKKSHGGIWSIGLLVGSVLVLCIPLTFLRYINVPWFIGLISAFVAFITIIFGITVHGYYSMKYLVSESVLTLKWSIFKHQILLNDIHTMSSITDSQIEGIRTFGVGIPGHLVGKFLIKFEGEFLPTTLYATKLENLVIIRTSTGNIYGITPSNPEDFINAIRTRNLSVQRTELDTRQAVRTEKNTLRQSRTWITVLYLLCFIIAISSLTYMIITYQSLPDTIPLHWGLGGFPDRFGNKSELLIIVSVFSGLEIVLATLVYVWMRKSDLGKIRVGIVIMLFPLLIAIVFSTIIIIIIQTIINYV